MRIVVERLNRAQAFMTVNMRPGKSTIGSSVIIVAAVYDHVVNVPDVLLSAAYSWLTVPESNVNGDGVMFRAAIAASTRDNI